MAYNKIDVYIDDGILADIMRNDKVFMDKIRQPEDHHDLPADEEYYVIDMVRMSYPRVVQVMINLGAAIFIDSKMPVRYNEGEKDAAGTPLFRIAHRIGNKDMLRTIMIH